MAVAMRQWCDTQRGAVMTEVAVALLFLLLLLTGFARFDGLFEGRTRLTEAARSAARFGAKDSVNPATAALSAFNDYLEAYGLKPSDYRCSIITSKVNLVDSSTGAESVVALLEVYASRIGPAGKVGGGFCARSAFVIEAGTVVADHIVPDEACFPSDS
jgi:Flp pilus assembly protein TadG